LNIEDEKEKENEDDFKDCFERANLPESKLTMKSIRFNCLCRALLLPALLLDFSANAQLLVFSNAAPAAIPRRASIILVVADGLAAAI